MLLERDVVVEKVHDFGRTGKVVQCKVALTGR